MLVETLDFWRSWLYGSGTGFFNDLGPHREQVIRSLLTLKLLSYQPRGTMAAAATTSLPEVIGGVPVAKDSLVRLHPSRRADAQDLFFADQVARVTAVLSDVDGSVHVAVVLVDDPAAELHDWYGRYLYFAPDELEPLNVQSPAEIALTESSNGKENQP